MLLSNRGGVLKVAVGDRGGSMVTSNNMGNGTKFKLSNVLPNVFSKIKGIRRNSSVQKLSSSSSVRSECVSIDIAQKDFSIMSRDSHVGERSPASPVRAFPQDRNGDVRRSSSPVLGQKAHDIRFPAESPIRAPKGPGANKSGSLSPQPPRILSSTEIVDPGCCSYDSTMALVPHDGRVRRVAPQAFGRCLIMSKCNSFNGSTHSDSDISETDSSMVQSQPRHSRARSVQLEGSSFEGYGLLTMAGERASRRSGKVSVRQRSRAERRDQKVKKAEQNHQLYGGGSSPIHAPRYGAGANTAVAKYCRADHTRDSSECRGSAFANSTREEGDHHDQTPRSRHSRPSRKLSFPSHDNAGPGGPYDDASYSSEDDFYKVVRNSSNSPRGHHQSRPTSANGNSQLPFYNGDNRELDPQGYTSSKVVYTEEERNHAASILRREALLAKTVLNASDGWAQVQLARLSHDEKPTRRASYDDADRAHMGDSDTVAYSREAKLVLNTQGWARENLRALAQANEVDRQNLTRLKAASLDLLVRREEEEEGGNIEYETFGLPPHSRDFFSQKGSRHPSPVGEEVEKYTEGRVDYNRFSPAANLSALESDCHAGHGEFVKPVADYGGNVYKKGNRTEKSEKEFGKPWDTEFPSFRSDSVLMGGGGVGLIRTIPEERAALIDCTECDAPTALTPRYLERQRQNKIRNGQRQEFRKGAGKVSSRSLSPREEAISNGVKNLKLSSQSGSPRSPHPRRSPSSNQEFGNGKKQPCRTSSPNQGNGGRRSTSRTPSPVQESFQHVKESSRTPSPARNQSPQASGNSLTATAEAGMQRLDSVAVVKASYDPYHDFRESMVEMILENEIRTSEDLEDLLQCYLSLNSSEYHKIIVQVFTDVWGDMFEQ